MIETAKANKNILGAVISYLLVTAVAIRGLTENPQIRLQIIGLLILFVVLMLAEPLAEPLFSRQR